MSSAVIISSKKSKTYKKRLNLSNKPLTIKVPGEKDSIYLKLEDQRIKWSRNGKRYFVGLGKCPIQIGEVNYPKISSLPLSKVKESSKSFGYNYFLVDRETGSIISTKFSKNKLSLNEKKATSFFKTPVIKRFHDVRVNPVFSIDNINYENDPYGHEYGALVADERVKKTTAALLLLWLLMLGYNHFLKSDKKEVTLIQIENKKEVLKERKIISNLLSTKGKDKINQRTSKKISKVISKKTSSKPSSSKKRVTKSKVTSVKNKTKRKVIKGKNNVASNIKSVKKPSPRPSLQDQLFSRKLVKGNIGAASNSASKILRGSRSGLAKGKNYGSSGSIKGGFTYGTGNSLGSNVSKRGSGTGNGNGIGAGGNGVGSLGSRVLLSGNGANISGGLTREQISKVVRRNKRDINRCYESRLQFSPKMKGRVTMGFSINAAGRVISSASNGSNINDKALQDCMARKIKTWRFDKPINGRTVKVSFPFNLSYNKGNF